MLNWRPLDSNPTSIAILLFTLVCCGQPVVAQTGAGLETKAAFLFAYDPHDGLEDEFHDGYQRHLEWHREAGDSLIWYGWEVLTGNRPGMFIDGTFGRPFLALDMRVDPAGDQADFQATAGSFAEPLFRTAYVLREQLSTATPLENGEPTPTIEVITYRVRPGHQLQFEALLGAARDVVVDQVDDTTWTWYELVNGDTQPAYLLMIHGRGLSGWDRGRSDLASVIRATSDGPDRDRLLESLAESVLEEESELWRYLPASSLIPER